MIAYHAAFDSRMGHAPFLGYDMYIVPAPPKPAAVLPTPEPFGPQPSPAAAPPPPEEPAVPMAATLAIAGLLVVGAVALVASTNAIWRKR